MKRIFSLLLLTAAISLTYAQQPETKENSSKEEEIFIFVEQEPEFPGGENAMYQFLSSNLVYPKAARENGIQGKVFIEFIVEKNGQIDSIRVIRSVSPELDAEAVRVISMMPKWKPGKQKGENVRARFRLPINFQLESQESDVKKKKK